MRKITVSGRVDLISYQRKDQNRDKMYTNRIHAVLPGGDLFSCFIILRYTRAGNTVQMRWFLHECKCRNLEVEKLQIWKAWSASNRYRCISAWRLCVFTGESCISQGVCSSSRAVNVSGAWHLHPVPVLYRSSSWHGFNLCSSLQSSHMKLLIVKSMVGWVSALTDKCNLHQVKTNDTLRALICMNHTHVHHILLCLPLKIKAVFML